MKIRTSVVLLFFLSAILAASPQTFSTGSDSIHRPDPAKLRLIKEWNQELAELAGEEQIRIVEERLRLVERRKDALVSIWGQDPAACSTLFLDQSLVQQLISRFPELGFQLEKPVSKNGSLEVTAIDSPGHSELTYILRTTEESVELFVPGNLNPGLISGTPVSVHGFQVGTSVLVSSLLPLRQMNNASDAQSVGQQRVLVLLVTFPGSPPLPLSTEEIQGLFFGQSPSSLQSYWSVTSYGRATVTGQMLGWYTLTRAYSYQEYDLLRQAALTAADADADFRNFNRIFIVCPELEGGNAYGGWSSVGLVAQQSAGDGVFLASSSTIQIRPTVPDSQAYLTCLFETVVHEGGHALGLGHATFRYWNLIDSIGPLNDPGTLGQPYTDFSTSMSTRSAHYNAPEKARLGWLIEGVDLTTITDSTHLDLRPLSGVGAGWRAAKVKRGSGNDPWLWLEFRQPGDAYDSDLESIWYEGVVIHYEDQYTTLDSHLIDFTPGSTGLNTDARLPIATLWRDKYSNLSLFVESLAPTSCAIDIIFEPFCVTLSPRERNHGITEEEGTVQVTAPLDCSWSARTDKSWITLLAYEGTGNGVITYRVSAATASQPVTGVIRVAGAVFCINRPPAANVSPQFQSLTPETGGGPASSFIACVADDNGADDVQGIYVRIGAENSSAHSVSLSFIPITNQLFLSVDGGGGAVLGTLGSEIVLQNSQGQIRLADCVFASEGNKATLTLPISFKQPFLGPKRIWIMALDRAGGVLPWQEIGTWYVHTFMDVPPTNIFYSYIETISAQGVTAGCGNQIYCPDTAVTRAQMAVFLEKAMRGRGFVPPAPVGLFSDVSLSHWAAAWIEKLAQDGVTAGCGAGDYCPDTDVTRAQMAVFLLKAKHGASYVPPAQSGVFADVPPGHWAGPWIEQLAAEGITAGCGPTTYCPDNPVTRGQMAVFLTKTFGF